MCLTWQEPPWTMQDNLRWESEVGVISFSMAIHPKLIYLILCHISTRICPPKRSIGLTIFPLRVLLKLAYPFADASLWTRTFSTLVFTWKTSTNNEQTWLEKLEGRSSPIRHFLKWYNKQPWGVVIHVTCWGGEHWCIAILHPCSH